jgi:hypothetical protein
MANYTNTPCVTDVTIRDSNGTLTDPTTLTVYLRDPSNSERTYVYNASGTWTNPSTGVYTFSFTPTAPGVYRLGFTGEHTSYVCTDVVTVDVTTLRPFD